MNRFIYEYIKNDAILVAHMPNYNYLAFLLDLYLNYIQCSRLQAFITFFQVTFS